jgi:mannan endo-1,4-beta-mannosidase
MGSETMWVARGSPGADQQREASGLATSSLGWVTRSGEGLLVDGQPFVFVGTNASFLAGPFFPASKMEETLSQIAELGVMVVRIWVEPWCDLTRLARLLDLGSQHGIRFIITLQDFFGQQDGGWFRGRYQDVDLPHIRNVVPLFADRPEILMWELMNEPMCPQGDAGTDCWDALVRWAETTSVEIKRLDAHHLISAGTLDARFDPLATEAFRRIHALPNVDVVSVHRRVGGLPETELRIAHELGKPIFFGEVQLVGHDESCQPISSDALQSRAERIAADLDDSLTAGVDGYLLWQYAYGPVDMGSHTQYFCGELDYFRDDPVWDVLRSR